MGFLERHYKSTSVYTDRWVRLLITDLRSPKTFAEIVAKPQPANLEVAAATTAEQHA